MYDITRKRICTLWKEEKEEEIDNIADYAAQTSHRTDHLHTYDLYSVYAMKLAHRAGSTSARGALIKHT